jgi:predicted short-subunit dehydrogenase-like oxidoreductase (DUF2520 family)
MIKVCIIGSGNVAQHLIVAFLNAQNSGAGIALVQVFSRQKESIANLLDASKITTDFNTLAEADLYIIAVSDDAIAEVSAKIPFKNKLVAHTSGTVVITALDNKNRKSVFYPLQTFSKNKAVDFKGIPICLESENPTDYKIIEIVAKSISNKVVAINSSQRKALHVSAVFVNNFVNHLYQIGNQICTENQIPFEILKPLIKETAEKIETLSPREAQTGPARRLDLETINTHLNFISDENQKKIYEILTQSIITDGKKL